jgi:cell division protein FtsW
MTERRGHSLFAKSSGESQRRHKPDYQIVLFVGLLMLLGLIIMYAIGPQRANVLNRVHDTDFYSGTYFVIKQAISLGLAGLAFFVMSKVPYEFLRKNALKFVYVGFALCALLFVGGNLLQIDAIAVNTLGAYRWFYLGPLGTFQPSEVLKFALLIFIATFLGLKYREGKLNNIEETVLPAMGMVAAALFIVVVIQKDLGTGLSIAATVFSMLIVSGMSWKILSRIALIGVAAILVLTIFVPHRRERLVTFLSGDDHSSTVAAEDTSYHIKNAMIALGSGGLLGLGIGNSVQATGYLPEAINDSVFAIIGETFGFVGALVVLLLFTALLMRILRVTDRLGDMRMRLVAAGVFGWLAAHVSLNVASMLGIVPLTGITLPLLSFGGTSMVFIAGALGLVFQLSRYTSHSPVIVKEESDEGSMRRRGLGGSRHSGRRRYQ